MTPEPEKKDLWLAIFAVGIPCFGVVIVIGIQVMLWIQRHHQEVSP